LKQANYLHGLQVLRFVAASLVLIGHIFMVTQNHGISNLHEWGYLPLLPWGSGVDIFFVISGFIIFYIARNLDPGWRSAIDFTVKRLIRIAPLYWFYTFLMLIAAYLFGSSLQHPNINVGHFLASLLLIAWPRPGDGALFPFLGQGWTLNYEIVFYSTAALTLFSARHLRIYYLTFAIIVAIVIGRFLSAGRPVIGFYTGSITLEFIFGVWLCHIQRSVRPLNPSVCLALIGIGVAGLLVSALPMLDDVPRALKQGVPATLIAAGFVLGKRTASGASRIRTILEQLGDASYSLYLSHPFVVNAVALVWLATVKTHPFAFALITYVAALAAARVSYLAIERPLLRSLRERWESDTIVAGSRRGLVSPTPAEVVAERSK